METTEVVSKITPSTTGAPKSKDPMAPVITRVKLADGGVKFIVIMKHAMLSAEAYVELVHELRYATAKDAFDILIQSPGGSVMVGIFLISAMRATKAAVTTIANGICASMGAITLINGKNVTARPWSQIMFHQTSHADSGKSATVQEFADGTLAHGKYITELAVRRGLLTEEEMMSCFDAKENVYIDGAVMAQRTQAGGA